MKLIHGTMDASGTTIGVVVSRWNELITKELLAGALDALKSHGDPQVIVVHVPGSWEIPVAASALIDRSKVDAVVALGCIMQGATAHADMLARDVSHALTALQVQKGVPVSWGVIVPENAEQALERTGLKMGNKGREAALAALEMISVLRQIS